MAKGIIMYKEYNPNLLKKVQQEQCEIGATKEMTAIEVLFDVLAIKTQELQDLQALIKALPEELSYPAERALKRMIRSSKNNF